jgi:hypothetical protein
MRKPEVNSWKWVGIIGGILGVLVAWSSLGFSLPWNAATKEYVDAQVKEQVKPLERKVNRGGEDLARMEGKLDVIIELLNKE